MMARVLIIDDEKIPRATVARVLGEAGYEVATAADGESGIRKARAWSPDVIILDVHMPGMDGFAVVERLKRDARTAAVPVVFLTGTAVTEAHLVRALDLGAFDFLSKGDSDTELLARVGVMVRIKRGHDELAAIAGISDSMIQTLDPGDLAGLFAREVGDVFRADAALFTLGPSADTPVVRAAEGLDPADPLAERFLEHVGGWLDEQGTGAALVPVDDVGGPAGALLRRERFVSVLAAHVRRDGSAPVLAAVLAAREDAFHTDSDPNLLRILARQAMVAIDNALLHARTQDQAQKLEHALTVRSRFFASMSHELRTPINAIVGYNQLLDEGIYGDLSEKQEQAIRKIGQSAGHLLELVNDVLDISKIEAGKLEVSRERTDLAALIHDTLTSVQVQAEDKGLELRTVAPETLVAVTDPARVRQILLNLLSNAVKFTDEGSVAVRLESRPPPRSPDGAEEGAAPRRAWIQVRDTGPGITVEDQERIFEEFEQVAQAVSKGGTGLGLAISRRLAELLGGELRLESTLGEGSCFTLELPLPADADGS